MRRAKFYGTAAIDLHTRILVNNGFVDSRGALVITAMESVDTGVIWRGSGTPGEVTAFALEQLGFPRTYAVEKVEVDCVRGETLFELEEITNLRM